MAELKRCPFCGSNNQKIKIAEESQIPYINKTGRSCCTPLVHYVLCWGCGAKTFLFENCNDAVDAWNRRIYGERN